jgi:hypothetical protein
MHCGSSGKKGHGGRCGCGCGSAMNPHLWSTKKKIKMLEHHLECLEKRKEDILEALNELKEKS